MNLNANAYRQIFLLVVLGYALGAPVPANAQAPDGGGASQLGCNCLALEPVVQQKLRPLAGIDPLGTKAPGTVLQRYPFLPIGGILGNDLGINNFVDLNPAASAILDAFGGAATYDGHTGHDIDLTSFTEQDLGVPVFAALDGTVSSVHDGEYDRQVVNSSATANYVILNHAIIIIHGIGTCGKIVCW
jgi:murein DD-endopeptidase MepM/ murein hydrolase activator NlpD